MPIPADLREILNWYQTRVRPLVGKYLPDREGEWVEEVKRLDGLVGGVQCELPVCFLGSSGVGKSTLINALVAGDRIVLPNTGVGPLTAQAVVVRHGEQPAFEVEYHSPAQVAGILLPLTSRHVRERKLATPVEEQNHVEALLPQEEVEKCRTLTTDGESTTDEAAFSRIDLLQRQARQLITGKQDEPVDLPYVLDGLQEVLGRKRIWGTSVRPGSGDEVRIRRLTAALALAKEGKTYRQASAEASPGMRDLTVALQEHASGFLAPLIRRIEVSWNSPLLGNRLTLIDLPGLGASGDSFKAVTREVIPRARAVILVVNRSGIDQASADLLRSSGFLNRLKHAGDNLHEDPVQLVVAAVQIDSVAEERYGQDRSRPKRQHFAEVQAEMRVTLRDQLREELHAVWRMGGQPLTPREEAIIAGLVEGMEIHPISAVQHRKFLQQDEDDRAFIAALDQSGVGAMQESLIAIARRLHEQRRAEARRRVDSFRERVVSRLEEFRPAARDHQEDSHGVEARERFVKYAQGKREEYLRREGQLRAFWADGVTTLIREQVLKASLHAGKRIHAYLKGLAEAKVAANTLQAVVRRGGRFAGSSREIDLPNDLSLGFDSLIAEVWNDPILRDLLGRTTEFAGDCAALIEEIIAWAKDEELTDLLPALEAHARTIRADAELITLVGEESTARIRKEVRDRLVKEVETPITQKCRAFEVSGANEGWDVRRRILDLFAKLADDVLSAGSEIAVKLMTWCVQEVREGVTSVWSHRDPFVPVLELGQAPPLRAEPTTAELRQREVWKDIEGVLARAPGCAPEGLEAVAAGS